MKTPTARQTLLVSLIASAVLLLSGGLALAAQGDTIPHGGYDTTTDACLQCHDVHEAEGDYVLARWPTITAVCGSCHTLYQLGVGATEIESTEPQLATDPVWAIRWDGGTGGIPEEEDLGPEDDGTLDDPDRAVGMGTQIDTGGQAALNYNPNYSGLEAPVPGWSEFGDLSEDGDPAAEVGQGAPFEAYEKPFDEADGLDDGKRGHRLGTLFTYGDEIEHADGVLDELDYIPGSSNRLTAIATPSIQGITEYANGEAAEITNTGFMLETTSVQAFPTSLVGGLYCASCHTPHAQFSGEGDDDSNMISYEIKDKLLSKSPNHNPVPADLDPAVDTWENDGGSEFCAKCHDQRASSDDGGENHTHPDFACLICHGNEEVISPINPDFGNEHNDFPHTSANPNLLSQEPDGLCITCHSPGGIPLP